MNRFLGRVTFWGFVAFLFAKGALVLRQRETVAAVSALLAALLHACGPDTGANPPKSVAHVSIGTVQRTPMTAIRPTTSSAHATCADRAAE
jgi:hypothetical protein